MLLSPDPTDAAGAFRTRRRRGRGAWFLGALLVVALGVAAAVILRPIPVTTSDVVRGVAVEAVYATGSVEPVRRLTLRAKVAGAIDPFTFHEGDAVRDGELITRIVSPSLNHELARGEADRWAARQQVGRDAPELEAARARVLATEAELANARDELSREQRLLESGSGQEAHVTRAKARVARLEAERAALSAQLGSLRIELAARARGSAAVADSLAARVTDGDVRSPFTGVILAKYVEGGEVVAPHQPLFRVGTTDRFELDCAIDEADVARIAVGKTAAVSLHAFAGRVFKGKVVAIFPEAERDKKAFLTKIALDDPPSGLRSGMSAEVNIVVDEHPKALLAPAGAVDPRGNAWVVKGGRAERRSVKVGIRDLLRVEVLEGLEEGEQVVTAGADRLSEGARAAATFVKSDPSAPMPRPQGGGGGTL